jgi:serine/threonine protein kinase
LSKFKDFFFTENSFNIIIEYEEDCALKQKIKYNIDNHLSFEENYIWSLTIQLLNLVKFIKENKNIDFNLSISNLLLMNNGLLKLYNYGNELISNQDYSSTIQNFDYNIPPEYFNDDGSNNINADSSNIWIAGCIIYELCSSKHPFSGESKREYINKVIKGEYQPIEIKYSDDFNKLLSKMILTDPNKRASVDELLNSEIIKSRNIEVDDLKASDNININFTFKKNNLKETKRQKQSINEMFQNDKYEIMKFTLSHKDGLPIYGEEDFDLVETGKFNINQNYNIIINENNKNNDFKNKIIEEQNKKDRIIENNNFNYNNPYRNNNKNPINNQVKNSKDTNLLRGNKNNKNNNK